ncbi:uncharacterized protein [Ptychodera flava]|uniref:uncharacterized protein n=1 Tax=Ptychodera flava TaxID=63121 RepID=UPI003969DF38
MIEARRQKRQRGLQRRRRPQRTIKKSVKSKQQQIANIEKKLQTLKRNGELEKYVKSIPARPRRKFSNPLDVLRMKYTNPQEYEQLDALLALDEDCINTVLQFLSTYCKEFRDLENLDRFEKTVEWLAGKLFQHVPLYEEIQSDCII